MVRTPMKRRRRKVKPGDDKRMLDACRGQSCWLVVPGIQCSSMATVVPAHENMGKGMGLKVPDSRTVPACHACHAEFDQGRIFSRDEKRAIWIKAFGRWSAYRGELIRSGA
jgi:hypothetical protein